MSQVYIEDITEDMVDSLGEGAKGSVFLSVVDGMKINRAILDGINFLVTDQDGTFVTNEDEYQRVFNHVLAEYKKLVKEKTNGKTTK